MVIDIYKTLIMVYIYDDKKQYVYIYQPAIVNALLDLTVGILNT